jgi:ribulose-phosphate 3-epimerase
MHISVQRFNAFFPGPWFPAARFRQLAFFEQNPSCKKSVAKSKKWASSCHPAKVRSKKPRANNAYWGEKKMKLIAPSILSADFSKLGDEIKAVEAAGADWIHADVMDGHFVPNITIGPLIVEAVKAVTNLPIDVHLMIENPDNYIAAFASAGAAYISVQLEACIHLNRTIQFIKDSGAQAGVVLNPSTPVASLESILEYVDYVLIMSVNPGFGGQAFIPNSIDKIKALRKQIQDRSLNVLIEVDGGVNEKTIAAVAAAGTDVFVAGSAIFGRRDYQATIQRLRQKIGEK